MKPTADLPGIQWIPSNGTVGHAFIEGECSRCAKDAPSSQGKPFEECDDTELCPILAASFRSEAVEWRQMPDGEVKCLGFVEAGSAAPLRCDKTQDMFEGG